jgi:hypothetical protein
MSKEGKRVKRDKAEDETRVFEVWTKRGRCLRASMSRDCYEDLVLNPDEVLVQSLVDQVEQAGETVDLIFVYWEKTGLYPRNRWWRVWNLWHWLWRQWIA